MTLIIVSTLVPAPTAFAQDPGLGPYGGGPPPGYGPDGEPQAADPNALPPANLTTGPTPAAVWQLTQPDWQPLFQEIGRLAEAVKVPAPPRPEGPTLRNEAHVAYRYGHLELARELFFAHAALADTQAVEDLKKLRFCAYYRRPVWSLRWGVSIGLHGDTHVTDYAPIRLSGQSGRGGMNNFDGGMDEFDSPDFGGRGGPGDPGFGGRGGPPGMGPDGMGPPGVGRDGMGPDGMGPGGPGFDGPPDDLMMEEEMMGAGEFGGQFGGPGRGGSRRAAISIPEPQVTDPQVTERFDELMGAVASTVADGMRSRIEAGQFGNALVSVDPDAKNQGYQIGGEGVPQAERRMWIPGVVYLGEGSIQQMSKAAVDANVELLLHFDVALKEVRGGSTQNITRVKIVDCVNGKTVVLSGAMDSREVQRLQQANRGTVDSYLSEALEKFWGILDSRFTVIDFPSLTPEVARRRVASLLGDNSLSTLRKLAEIRFLGLSGWLTEEEVEQAFDIAVGSDGMTILYGAPTDAIRTLREIALRDLNESS
ncbi:hypothetical protein [Rhodopirellula sallentina]|nr:hypothetical protein [Rhodopirellula sallentina]